MGVAVSGTRVVVPVSDSATLRNTVAHVVRTTHDAATEGDLPAVIHFVYPLSSRRLSAPESELGEELLDRAAAWATEDLGENLEDTTIETAIIGAEEYLFTPRDYATVISEYAIERNLESVVLDPRYNPVGTSPLLPSLEAELRRARIDVEEAPVGRERVGPRLVRRATVEQLAELFVVSFVFYLVLAGSLDGFELATGAVTAGIVSIALWHVSFSGAVHPVASTQKLLRLLVFVPYLLWEITKANIEVAYVVLHPNLPIDPSVVEFDAAVWSPVSVTTLANSITLTPGTLTIDVTRWHFTVHSLTQNSRESLLDGGLERAVRFVFYGRSAARIPSPAERREDGEAEP